MLPTLRRLTLCSLLLSTTSNLKEKPIMSKIAKSAGLLAVMVGVAVFGFAQSASADTGYVGESVAGLSNSPVYVDSDASLSNSSNIAATLKGTKVDVVALPDVAVSTYSANDVADMIRQKTGDTTVVVIDNSVGSDRFGVSSSQNEEKIAETLNKSLAQHNGDAGDALNAVSSDVVALTQTSAVSTSGEGFNPVPGIIGIGGGILGIILAVIVIPSAIRYSLRTRQKALPPGAGLIAIESVKTDEERLIENSISALRAQMATHRNEFPTSVQQRVEGILGTLQELLPQWKKMDTYGEQKFTINSIITDYLPNLLNSYLELPKSYLARKQSTVEAKLLEPLDTLQSGVNDIQDNVYDGVEKRIAEQALFLDTKFNKSAEELKLR
jgi:hypothetical protein